MTAATNTTHEGRVYADEGPRGAGFWAACRCGWKSSGGSGPKAEAEAELAEHIARPTTGLAVMPAAAAATQTLAIKQWTHEQIEMATRSFAQECTLPELQVFAESCHRKNLDPWLGQIVAIKRNGKMIIQETIDGYRTIAERSGLYGGWLGPWWRSANGDWDEVWLGDEPPAAAKILVIRKDWADPAPGVATWASNAQFYRDKKTGTSQLVPIWKERPDEMLAKCAEVRALKRAFSKEFALAGINTRELSDAQIVTVEARRAGLSDDARHALAAKVSGGRTDSTRELTEAELLAARAEVAALPDDRDDEPSYIDVDEDGVLTNDDPASEADHATLIARLGEWNRLAAQTRRASLHDWMAAQGIERGRPLKEYDRDTLAAVADEIDQRDRNGWPGEDPF